MVAVLGHLRVAAEELQIPGLDGRAESIHLPAGIVEVVLALDLVTGEGQQARERIADRGVPSVADREGTGGVRGHELHLDPLARGRAGAVPVAVADDLPQDVVQPVIGGPQVDEAGPRDLRLLEERRGGKCVHDRGRRRPWIGARSGGEDHRDVGGEVAELLLAGSLELRLGERRLEPARGRRPRDGFGEQGLQPVLDHPVDPDRLAHDLDELRGVERFRHDPDVLARVRLELLGASPRQEDDGERAEARLSPEALEDLVAVHPRHRRVEDERVGGRGDDARERVVAAPHGFDRDAGDPEVHLEEPVQDGVVVGEQHARRGGLGHAPRISPVCPRRSA